MMPIPPGAPIVMPCMLNVLIGSMPAARMTDLCVCIPPPPLGGDAIITGAFNVLIGNLPAARMTDLTAKGGTITTGFPTVLIGMNGVVAPPVVGPSVPLAPSPTSPSTGLGADVDAMVAQSPTLQDKLDRLQADGWTIVSEPGTAAWADRTTKEIHVGTGGTTEDTVQSLAHEAGHADYTMPAQTPPTGLTRSQYVTQNLNRHLDDEGEATLTNMEVRNEILAAGGSDIGIAGNAANQPAYNTAYTQYQSDGDRNAARRAIGGAFADGETTSTTGESYRDYYSNSYETYYDSLPASQQTTGP